MSSSVPPPDCQPHEHVAIHPGTIGVSTGLWAMDGENIALAALNREPKQGLEVEAPLAAVTAGGLAH
jgi:hypothetical protein